MRYILVQLCNANASKCLRPAWPAQVVAEAFQKRSWKLGLLGGHLVQPKDDLPEVSLYKEPAGSSPSSTRGDPTKRCIQHHGAFGVKSTPSDRLAGAPQLILISSDSLTRCLLRPVLTVLGRKSDQLLVRHMSVTCKSRGCEA